MAIFAYKGEHVASNNTEGKALHIIPERLCPLCRAKLEYMTRKSKWHCKHCQKEFNPSEGIVVAKESDAPQVSPDYTDSNWKIILSIFVGGIFVVGLMHKQGVHTDYANGHKYALDPISWEQFDADFPWIILIVALFSLGMWLWMKYKNESK